MTTTSSALHRETIRYRHDGKDFEGALVFDGAAKGRRPGVLVAHTAAGLDADQRRRAVQLARLGYAAFALDMYGDARVAKDADEAAALARELLEDLPLLRGRAQAALKILREQRVVESRNLAALGFGFGGAVVLELARAGADLRGVVSFDGPLDRGQGTAKGKIQSRILAVHGNDAPPSPDSTAAFQREMTEAEADWQFLTCGGARPETADARAWKAACSFLREIFD